MYIHPHNHPHHHHHPLPCLPSTPRPRLRAGAPLRSPTGPNGAGAPLAKALTVRASLLPGTHCAGGPSPRP